MKYSSQAFALFLLSAASVAAQSKSQNEVMAADKGWAKAIMNMDYQELDRLLSPDLVYTHSTGAVDTKQSYLDSLKSGAQKYNSVEHVDPKVQVFGSGAVLTSGLKMDTTTKGANQKASFRVTHVWVKKGKQWQMVAHQTTRLP